MVAVSMVATCSVPLDELPAGSSRPSQMLAIISSEITSDVSGDFTAPRGRLEGKVAIVTGAGRGIGRAIAIRLASEGAHVVGAQRDAAEGDELARTLAAEGLGVTFVAADVRDGRDAERLVAKAADRHGRIDILCNNAGVGLLKSITE